MALIRRLAPDTDVATFRDIRLRALRGAAEAFGSTYEAEALQPEDAWERRLAGAAIVWGAFADDVCVGMVGMLRQQPLKLSHKAALWGMFVDAEARRRGVGGLLTDAVIAQCRSENLEIVQLSCVTTNAAARALYESRGFVVYGTEMAALKYDGSYYDEHLMALDIRRPNPPPP